MIQEIAQLEVQDDQTTLYEGNSSLNDQDVNMNLLRNYTHHEHFDEQNHISQSFAFPHPLSATKIENPMVHPAPSSIFYYQNLPGAEYLHQ